MNTKKSFLFVVPASNSLPGDTVSTEDLTASQFGIFQPSYVGAGATEMPTVPYFYLAQGRSDAPSPMGTLRTSKIYVDKIVESYRITGSATATNQVTTLTNFSAKCEEDITLTLRLDSSYIRTIWANGLTKSVTVKTPCCDCDGNPCDEVDDAALIASLVAAINGDPILSKYVTASSSGTPVDSLVITGKALTKYGTPCDIVSFPYEFDKMTFKTFIYAGPATSQDPMVYERCESVATVTLTTASSYPHGTPDEIRQIEKDYHSYTTPYGHLYKDIAFNGGYTSNVSDSVPAYTLIYLRYRQPKDMSYSDIYHQDEWAIIAAPATEASAIVTRLELALGSGAIVDKSPA